MIFTNNLPHLVSRVLHRLAKPLFLCSFGFSFLLLTAMLQASIIYDFVDDPGNQSPFDATGVGASDTRNDPAVDVDVTLTTIDVIGLDGTLASEGTANITNVVGNQDALGINSANNGSFSNEFRDINPGEGWVFSFDVGVKLIEMDLESQSSGADLTLSSSAFPSIILADGQENDAHDLGNVFVPANTAITLQFTGGLNPGDDTSVRVTDFTISAVIPEPTSLALVSVSLLVTAYRRI